MSAPRPITNPFPGLRPFETNEYRLFFGREGQSDALIERLQRARFLAVVGTSGSGKSSLVRAGLLPALRGGMMAGAGAGWRVAVMRPGHDPVGNLARVLAEEGVLAELGAGLPAAEAEAIIEATLRRGSLGLVDAVRQARLAAHEKLLLVVDQFEELFRFRAARAGTGTEDEAFGFVKLLLETRQSDKPTEERLSIYVVLTMRSDFLGDCAQFQGLPEAINDGQYLIPRMSRDERRFAIVGPVRVSRGRVTEPLVNRLLNDVGDNPDQLPILQHALMRTWDYWQHRRRDGEPIGIEHYEAVGTMSDALSLHADEAFNELHDGGAQQLAEQIFRALTERGADNREIRRPTRLREICEITEASEAEVVAVIEVFRREGRSFLMPPVGVALKPETVIDISHESLIRNWKRLKDWVADEAQCARTYRRLAESAVLHHEGTEGLLQNPALQIALDWCAKSVPNAAWGRRYHPAEFDTAMAYLEESRVARDAALAERERRQQEELERERREREQAVRFAAEQSRAAQRLRRQRRVLLLVSMIALCAAGGAAYAFARSRSSEALAKASETRALDEQGKATAAEKQAEGLAVDLKKSLEKQMAANVEAESRRIEAEKAEKKSEESEHAALKAKKTAEEERLKAQTEAVRANAAATSLRKEFDFSHDSRDATAAYRRGDMQNALNRFAALLRMAEGDPVKKGWVYSNLGATQRRLGLYESGVASYKHARELQEQAIRENKLADGDPEYIDTLNGLAQLYSDRGAYKMAEPLYTDALGVRKRVLGSEHAEVATGLEALANNYYDQGEYDKAKGLYEEALGIRRKYPDSPDLTSALSNVAEFYAEGSSDITTAIQLYKELLGLQEKRLEPDDPNVAATYSNLARLYDATDENIKADRLDKIAKKIWQKTVRATDSANTLVYYEELADMYAKLGKYAEADAVYAKAIEAFEKPPVSEDDTITFRLASGDFYREIGEYDKAEDAYQYVIKSRSVSGKSDSDLFKALEGLADMYRARKNYADAEEAYKNFLAAMRKESGTAANSSLVAHALDSLAGVHFEQGKYSEAEQQYKQALGMVAPPGDKDEFNFDGPTRDNKLIGEIHAHMAALYRKLDRAKEAGEHYDAAVKFMTDAYSNAAALSKKSATRAASEDYVKTGAAWLKVVNDAGQFYIEQNRPTDELLRFYELLALNRKWSFADAEEVEQIRFFESLIAVVKRTSNPQENHLAEFEKNLDELRKRLAEKEAASHL